MAAKLLLDLDRSHRGIYLDRSVELLVVRLAQIIEELARPGTAIAAIGIKARIEAECGTGNDRNQILTGFQLLQFGVVLNAGQIHAINFVILQQQGFARRTKYRIPAEATKVSATDPMRATRRNVAVQSKSRCTDGSQQETKVSRFESYVSRSGLKLFLCRDVPGRLRQARILNRGCTKTRAFFMARSSSREPPGPLPLVTELALTARPWQPLYVGASGMPIRG